MKGMQDMINLLCTGLVEGGAAVLGAMMQVMESKGLRLSLNRLKSEPRESGFPGGGAGFKLSVVNSYTWTDGGCVLLMGM